MTAARITNTARTGTAHPPLLNVKPTSVWLAERMNRPRPWWRRIMGGGK